MTKYSAYMKENVLLEEQGADHDDGHEEEEEEEQATPLGRRSTP